MSFLDELAAFLETRAQVRRGDRLLVAFSGGPDSTALLWGLNQLAPTMAFEIAAAHLDHGLDDDSRRRSALAGEIASRIGVPLTTDRRRATGRGGLEAVARAVRYRFLEEERRRFRARYVATAHHRDDQAETVVLRLLYGSGLDGLASIAPLRGSLIRPLLDIPRAQIDRVLLDAGLSPTEDPTNHDLSRPRNRVRSLLIPALENEAPDLKTTLAGIAKSARGARQRIDERLLQHLQPRIGRNEVRVRRQRLEELRRPIFDAALICLHRLAGTSYPLSTKARSELSRQLRSGVAVGCHCGDGWAWESRGEWLRLSRRRPNAPPFTYTLSVPGSVQLGELGLRIRVTPSGVSSWMFHSSPHRAALGLPLRSGERVTVRNRRPGDRIQPFGWERYCRVKQLLINRRVPREERSRLPLLCYDGEIAWIPGVAISERSRISSQQRVWIAEIDPV